MLGCEHVPWQTPTEELSKDKALLPRLLSCCPEDIALQPESADV
jgi:hypothetical protein